MERIKISDLVVGDIVIVNVGFSQFLVRVTDLHPNTDEYGGRRTFRTNYGFIDDHNSHNLVIREHVNTIEDFAAGGRAPR